MTLILRAIPGGLRAEGQMSSASGGFPAASTLNSNALEHKASIDFKINFI
jgi:hypothetical protein